jgi:hypothetical protein
LLFLAPPPAPAAKPTVRPGTATGAAATPARPAALMDHCAKAPPDAEYFIPESFSQKVMPSGSGGYGYRSRAECPFWIVDFSLNSRSNTQIDPETGERLKESTHFRGDAFDLPSSQQKNGIRPIVAEDCQRLFIEYTIYTKMKHESAFILRNRVRQQGDWKGGSCNLKGLKPGDSIADVLTYKAPDANVLVVRVVVGVKLRSSWQEAAAIASDGPPE